jgi:hypothetical protein
VLNAHLPLWRFEERNFTRESMLSNAVPLPLIFVGKRAKATTGGTVQRITAAKGVVRFVKVKLQKPSAQMIPTIQTGRAKRHSGKSKFIFLFQKKNLKLIQKKIEKN